MPVVELLRKACFENDWVAHDTRLIDNGTLGLEASISGQAERYGRGKTSHTIQVWWERRPHGALRALVFASIMPESGSGKGVFAYFWSYRLRCTGCGYEFLLTKRPWLSRKMGRHTALSVSDGNGKQLVTIEDDTVGDQTLFNPAWSGRNGTARCPA